MLKAMHPVEEQVKRKIFSRVTRDFKKGEVNTLELMDFLDEMVALDKSLNKEAAEKEIVETISILSEMRERVFVLGMVENAQRLMENEGERSFDIARQTISRAKEVLMKVEDRSSVIPAISSVSIVENALERIAVNDGDIKAAYVVYAKKVKDHCKERQLEQAG